jgi:pimeloyl-ACP methyl ester carboxylesterase
MPRLDVTTFDKTSRLAVEVDGAGPPVLLVHGITDRRQLFQPLVDRLAPRHTVVRFDLRGHGESTPSPVGDAFVLADDLEAVCQAVGVTRPAIIGHSFGGLLGAVHAARRGARAVVNVDQPLRLAPLAGMLRPAAPLLGGPGFHALMVQIMTPMLGDRLPPATRDEILRLKAEAPQAMVLAMWKRLLEDDDASLEAAIDEGLRGSAEPFLEIASSDRGPDYAPWLDARIPGAKVEVAGGLGHYLHLADPDGFVARIGPLLG